MTAPATTAADAPGLANLQGLLHVYKQSLDNVGRDAVEQLRHTLAPSDEEDLHEEDTGKHASLSLTTPGSNTQHKSQLQSRLFSASQRHLCHQHIANLSCHVTLMSLQCR